MRGFSEEAQSYELNHTEIDRLYTQVDSWMEKEKIDMALKALHCKLCALRAEGESNFKIAGVLIDIAEAHFLRDAPLDSIKFAQEAIS